MENIAKNLRPQLPNERIIVALDTPDRKRAAYLTKTLGDKVGMFKIGKELFTALGPDAVAMVRDSGAKVFLDLKYHDIPNTVAGAVRSAMRLGVSMLTLHASGGFSMLKKAVDEAARADPNLCILAVTVLTSLDEKDLKQIGFALDTSKAVLRLASLALEAGVGGLVCSPREAPILRSTLGRDPILVTPGIRPEQHASQDQARTATPRMALQNGADFLVIGRPITESADPVSALADILADLRSSSE